MCCLKYEDEAYKDLRKDLPKMNSVVEYEGEKFRVTSMNVIAGTCKLDNKEHSLFITLDDLVKNAKFQKPKKLNNNEEESADVQ